VPTATFRVLYVFIIINHDRRKVVHFNVTTNPNAPWAAQQIVNAFPYESSPRFLIHDQDGCYGECFQSRIEQLDITEVTTTAGAPWQNTYAERIIGSIRRECLDHLIVLNEIHLRRLLKLVFDYYHNARPHLSLDRNSPIAREVEPPCQGRVISQPMVGGLHHQYSRAA
jgi:putative transposase